MATRVIVNADLCTGTGYCVRDLPKVFCESPDGSAFVRDDGAPLAPELVAAAQQAASRCPTGAIELSDD